ncbi:ATP/GTP-binding protein [Acidobacteriota bacterium]
MAFINYTNKKIAIKIVYYGPGLSGKTTNLKYIFTKIEPQSRGDFICLETDAERTYFFDLLPIKAGLIGDFQAHFSLMTVPGQVFYEASRRSVLKGADGVVFVADSQMPLLDSNLESFDGMRKNLLAFDLDLNTIPLVFQYNKRDLDNLIPLETFNNLMNPNGRPFVEASAINGDGVFETLREIAKVSVPIVKEIVMGEKKEPAVAKDTKTKVEFFSNDELSPVQMTKLKLETRDDVDSNVKKLIQKVTAEEDQSK